MSDAPDRYARQALLPEVGAEGQRRFAAAHVAVAGRGTAARVCALYLAGAGVGRLEVAPALVEDVRALNPEIDVRGGPDASSGFSVRLVGPDAFSSHASPGRDAVDAGAAAALAVLKRLLQDAPT